MKILKKVSSTDVIKLIAGHLSYSRVGATVDRILKDLIVNDIVTKIEKELAQRKSGEWVVQLAKEIFLIKDVLVSGDNLQEREQKKYFLIKLELSGRDKGSSIFFLREGTEPAA